MVKMMEKLGFQVIIAGSDEETSNIEKFSPVVNSCSVMVGVHGAGMTNEIYLPEGAVMILVRPLGFQDYLDVFSEAAPDMGLKYLEYKIKPEESSLVDEYGLDHPVLQNTSSVTSKGWAAGAAIYLEKQNVRLDMNRFRGTLVEALRFIGQSKEVIKT
ncbi:xylan glycosyltransferase MUCI21-like [Rutidosis leptorrhynchoides]|uniref:xylan glycosyltransferase MUCI21-like n=1 Tax=Rutidosis leptorrhynchoides TaxID=125765 RepID=UPI003A99790F